MDDKTVEMFERIWAKLSEIPTKEDVEAMIKAQKATDWKSIAKIAAIVIPSGGLGAGIAEIIKAATGG